MKSDDTDIDLDTANWYIKKKQQAEDRGIEFNMSLLSLINIRKAKKCYYTGVELNKNTVSIDRIDSKTGYVKGNVVACHKTFNRMKGMIEGSNGLFTIKGVKKAFTKAGKILSKEVK